MTRSRHIESAPQSPYGGEFPEIASCDSYRGLADEGLTPADWIAFASRRFDWYRRLARRIRRRYSLAEGIVLDIGCGEGSLAAALRDVYPVSVQVLGVDIDAELIDWANRNRVRPGLRFQRVQEHGVELEQAAFALVVSTYVVHHWREPARFYRVVRDLLRPGGAAYIMDLDPDSLWNWVSMRRTLSRILHHDQRLFEAFVRSSREACGCGSTLAALEAAGLDSPRLSRRRGHLIVEFANR